MSKLTCRDMDATVVFLDLEELWMGSTGDTILAFGCCYIHFCFIVVVIGYIMSLVNFIVIVCCYCYWIQEFCCHLVVNTNTKNMSFMCCTMLDCLYTNTKIHKCKYKSNRCCKMHDWCYTTTSCMFLQVCLHFIFLKFILLLKLRCKLLFNSKIQL